MGEEELIREIGAEESGVVGVDRDEEAVIEVAAQRMDGKRGADASADVGGGVELDGDAAIFELREQRFVLNGGDGVADALGADGESFPDGLGAGGFAGVAGEAQAGGLGAGVEMAERLGTGAAFVAAEADSDDGGVEFAQLGGLTEDAVGFLDSEVADGVEDPVEGQSELAGGALTGALKAGEDGLEAAGIEVAPHIDDADGDEDLGVNHALGGELLHHSPGGQLVVFGVAQASGDGLEGLDKLGEVSEAVEGLGFVWGQGVSVVAGAELDQGGGRDGAFKVQMQLGLGQAADEFLDFRHTFSLAGQRVSKSASQPQHSRCD